MGFDETLMTLQVKELCRNEEGNGAAQNFSVRLSLYLHLTFSIQILSCILSRIIS
jgi:hypothetical protein